MSVFEENIKLCLYLRDVLYACPFCVLRLLGAPKRAFFTHDVALLREQLRSIQNCSPQHKAEQEQQQGEQAHVLSDALRALRLPPVIDSSTCCICLNLYQYVNEMLTANLGQLLQGYSNYGTYKLHLSVPMLCTYRDALLFSHLSHERLPLFSSNDGVDVDKGGAGGLISAAHARAAMERMGSMASKHTMVAAAHLVDQMGPLRDIVSTREALTWMCEAIIERTFVPRADSTFELDVWLDSQQLYSGPKDLFGMRCTKKIPMSSKRVVAALAACDDVAALGSQPWAQIPFRMNRKKYCGATVTVSGVSMSFGGRYLKKARNIPQSPWFVGGTAETDRIGVSSVEECIEAALRDWMQGPAGPHTFIPSGREDRNVRMMGNGRPFVLIFRDVRIPTDCFPDPDAVSALVKQASQGSVEAVNLCLATPEMITAAKTPHHRKSYRAVVRVLGDETPTAAQCDQLDVRLKEVTDAGGVVVSQWTPVRVLHRRPLLARTRKILDIQVERWGVPGRVCVVHLTTEAGTYIKEFIHGDLGRTSPSFSEFLGFPVDILLLDVAGVHPQ